MITAAVVRVLSITGALALGACASPQAPAPRAAADPPRAQPAPAPADALAHGLAERAARAERESRWTEAALAWEALTLVHPEDMRAQDRLAAVRSHITQRADAQQALGDASLRQGDVDLAVQAYLEVLSLDPSRDAVADALRRIERDRTRRAQVGRFARPPAGRHADAERAMTDTSERGRSANNLREHASLLAAQGEVDGAIQLLRESPLLRRDAGLRALLADLHVRQAEAFKPMQPAAARAAVEAALALDPRHAGALALRQQLPAARARPPATQKTGAGR